MFLTNKTFIKYPDWTLSHSLLMGFRKLQQLLGGGDLCLPAGGAGGPPDDVTEQLFKGLQIVFVGEAVDDGVDKGGGPGEDVSDHVQPAQLGGRDGVEDSEDSPREETDEEGEVDQSKRQGQAAFSFFGLSGDTIRAINFH